MPFHAHILTLFPDMFPGALGHSLAGKALEKGLWQLSTYDIRDYALDKHRTVDDTPYGGGAGMVLKPEVVDAAVLAARAQNPGATLIHFSPRGEAMTQPLLRELVAAPVILLCGRYEAVDERVIEKHQPREISLGDFVLTGGDIPAMALMDGCVRLLPGVIGKEASLGEESFGMGSYQHLLEYPHYTKPALWEGRAVPETLLSGHHAQIDAWRKAAAVTVTRARRPDLWARYQKK